jgi:16S rRNA (cytosine967-C5)-methyltransferase
MQPPLAQTPLWRQLQAAAFLLGAVRRGQSTTTVLETIDSALRPGAQALGFHALRWLGRAEALRDQLARRPPPPEVDALLCAVLACLAAAPGVGEKTTSVGQAGLPPDAAQPDLAAVPVYTAYTLVDQAVEAAKRDEATRHQASFINGCLRRFLRERDELMARTDRNPQAVYNHPQWWIDRLRKDHPGQWEEILHANNRQASLILRINQRKTTQAHYLSTLSAINIEAFPAGEYGVALRSARAVPSLPGFDDGHFSVQDSAAQLAAPLLLNGLSGASGPAGLRILDACAAPGGKTAHLLELADCEVTALDIDASRCQRIGQNLARLSLQARITVADAGAPGVWWDGLPYDGILLDAPCTASGIVRRHPDVRWLRRPSDITQLAAVQAHLLVTLWPLVRPGGRLLYCTCSVFHAEGKTRIETFLAHHTDARLMPSPGHLVPQNRPAGQLFPDNLSGEHDGFYYALLEKQKV